MVSYANLYLYHLSVQQDGTHPHSFTQSSTQTSRGQAAADGSVEARLTNTWIWIKNAAQLDLTQPGDLSVTAPLVLQRQLVPVQHQWAQAALKTILGSGWAPCTTVPQPGPALASPRPLTWSLPLPRQWPHLGPEEKGWVWGQRPQTDRCTCCSAALHVAVIQRQEGVVPCQLQGNSVPEAVIYWPARDTHNAEGVVTVQLEPESTAFNLWKEKLWL